VKLYKSKSKRKQVKVREGDEGVARARRRDVEDFRPNLKPGLGLAYWEGIGK
jgi:hypothetical protein